MFAQCQAFRGWAKARTGGHKLAAEHRGWKYVSPQECHDWGLVEWRKLRSLAYMVQSLHLIEDIYIFLIVVLCSQIYE